MVCTSRVARVVGMCGVLASAALLEPLLTVAQQRIAIADPAFGYLVEGRVLHADARPAAGVQVERAGTQNYVGESVTTGADGAFRFEAHGLGWGPGNPWTVTLRRTGCPDVTRTIALRQGPIDGRARDEALGVVLRLPACGADRRAAPVGAARSSHRTR